MESNPLTSRGFTLIASLLLLVLMSGMAIGLLMMVNTESQVGSHDVENTLAYRGAEGAIEQMTANLANTFQSIQAPSVGQITALSAQQPVIPGITFPLGGYTVTPHTTASGALVNSYGQISGGPNAGLYAQLLPIDLAVTAQRPLGDQVSMMRTVQVALIPVFQFGVFSDSDLSFFSSPTLDFAGRVHTNGDLYLGVATGYNLTFHDKITAYGNAIRMQIPNGLAASGNNDDGNVYIPTASGGCDGAQPACRVLSTSATKYREGSTTGGPTASQYSGWKTISTGSAPSGYNGWVVDGNYGNPGGTGAKALTLPFVSAGSVSGNTAQPFEIIRRLPKFGQPSTPADPSRLSEQAQIRVLLSDVETDLHLIDWNGDPTQDIQLDNVGWAATGVPVPGLVGVGGNNNTYFATANINSALKNTDGTSAKYDANFVQPYGNANQQWPLIGGWLLVEIQESDGLWHGVTQEWLKLGFARGLVPPVSATVHPNAILMLQMLADRNGNGTTTDSNESSTVAGPDSKWNWFPINLYDTREGEVRDWLSGGAPGGAASCSVNGIMNVVELDVGNLKRWLSGSITGSGTLVDYQTQNGYVLYFSDRRGMLPDPNAVPSDLQGEYGFEDVINTASGTAGTPDGVLEPPVTIKGKSQSPEDTNGNGRLDNYGGVDVGDGFGLHSTVNASARPNPYARISSCYTVGRKNRITGARHALKLVDGSLGNVPTQPGGTGGFTVASENPVYIQGNYNSSAADPTWLNPSAADPAHAAAAVIADTVTLLSNNWMDTGYSASPGGPTSIGSFYHPTDANLYRPASTTYYRVAIAAGKTISFPYPSFSNPGTYFGTDGGLHNFLRFLESWSGQNLYYKGSMVSLYYSTYNTGTFKCCNYVVYTPPTRHYTFDPLFTSPNNLPPGTPMFRDVNNLSYRQNFTPQ